MLLFLSLRFTTRRSFRNNIILRTRRRILHLQNPLDIIILLPNISLVYLSNRFRRLMWRPHEILSHEWLWLLLLILNGLRIYFGGQIDSRIRSIFIKSRKSFIIVSVQNTGFSYRFLFFILSFWRFWYQRRLRASNLKIIISLLGVQSGFQLLNSFKGYVDRVFFESQIALWGLIW